MDEQTKHVNADKQTAGGSRRRRLWDLPRKYHCPVIGVCFDSAELAALIAKTDPVAAGATDYDLHTRAVSECGIRTPLAERLQRQLERRHALTVRRFAAAKSAGALRQLWCAEREGGDMAGALWAAWSHPRCDEELAQEIYGDVHMLQHQVNKRRRAEALSLAELRADNARLKHDLSMSKGELMARLAQKNLELERMKVHLDESEARYRGKASLAASLTARLSEAQTSAAYPQELAHALQQMEYAEQRSNVLEQSVADLEAELNAVRNELACAEGLLRWTRDDADARLPSQKPFRLSDRSVLCVGGKGQLVEVYRGLVERCGGRFLHHDGGLKDNAHRLEASLDGADAVICQAGCISHNAYWRVKDYCKRTGKQCVYLKSSGVTSFASGIAQVAELVADERSGETPRA